MADFEEGSELKKAKEAKAELKRVLDERYEIGLVAIDDPDLVDQ